MHANCEWGASVDLNDLMATLVAVLRADGHLSNVLTHVGRGNWRSIEAAIGAVLAPRMGPSHLDGVARNVLELICDGRGVTGPIMQAVFFGTIDRELSRHQARRLKKKIRRLRRRVAAADLAQRRIRRLNAELEMSVQPQIPEQVNLASASGQPSNLHGPVDSDKSMPTLRTPAVEFGTDGIYVDAALIAAGSRVDSRRHADR